MTNDQAFQFGRNLAHETFYDHRVEDLAGVLAGFRAAMAELLRSVGDGSQMGPLRDAMIQMDIEPSLVSYTGQESGSDCVM